MECDVFVLVKSRLFGETYLSNGNESMEGL